MREQSGVGVSLVIPAHNEAEGLERLIVEILQLAMYENSWDIVVVDDGSTDATTTVLRRLQAVAGNLRVVVHAETRGQSAAVLSGVTAARSDWIVTLDGDGQNDPADISPILTTAREASADGSSVLVIGRRALRRDPVRKRALSWVLNRFSSIMLRHSLVDRGCGLKAFRRSDYLALPRFDHMHRFLPALFPLLGAVVISVQVNHRPRLAGRSHYGTIHRAVETIADVFGILWLKRRHLLCEAPQRTLRSQ